MSVLKNTDTTRAPIPVTIIGGFLGSGKTSLLTHILTADHGMRITVLVNDFGEINVDANLVVSIEGQNTVSMANGCICCTIRDDLLTEVLRLFAQETAPEYIVIETSGVSDPAVVAQTFLLNEVRGFVEVDSIVSMLDADLSAIPEEYQELARRQVEVADIVVLNKIDLVSSEQLEEMRRYVKQAVPKARLVETTYGRVPLEMVLGLGAFDSEVPDRNREKDTHVHRGDRQHGEHDHAEYADDHANMFTTWTYRTERHFSFNAMQRAIEHLPDGIYRAKGTVKLAIDPDERGILQVTGSRGWLKLDGNWPATDTPMTELVFIGKPGASTNDGIRDHFEQALEAAERQGDEGYLVSDLRAFNVVFA